MFIEDRLGNWVHDLRWDDIPENVRSISRMCVMDGVSVALAGSRNPTYEMGASAVRGLAGTQQGPCTVLGASEKAGPALAASLNAMAMHVLDFDDTSYAGILHATAVVLPAAMAVTEWAGGTVQDLYEAYVAGVEVELALGTALTDSLYDRGHWTTAALGVVGAAVAASKALGLDAARIAEAIRIALNTSIGMRSAHGTPAKPYLCGQAASLGLDAAWAARAGICAGPGSLVGRFAFAEIANGGVLQAEAFDALGQRYYLQEPGMALKRYPVCSAAQAAIEAVLELKNTQGFELNAVRQVQVYGTALVVSCLVHTAPASVSQAQFSMQFAVATALLQGDVGVQHLSLEWIGDEALQLCMKKISLHEDLALVAAEDLLRYPEAARVVVTFEDATVIERSVLAARGMPSRPLTQAQLHRKFTANAAQVLGEAQADRFYGRFKSAPDAMLLTGLLDVDEASVE